MLQRKNWKIISEIQNSLFTLCNKTKKMEKETPVKKIKKDLITRLTAMEKKVTTNMVYSIAANTGYSDRTVKTYLSGEVANVETAEDILLQAEFELDQ